MKRFLKIGCLGVLSLGVLIMTIAILASGTQPGQTVVNSLINKPSITMAEFEQIKTGMSYAQVAEIIGGPGEMVSEVGRPGDLLYTVAYKYQGEGSLGANAQLMFQSGKLNSKAQSGLK